MDAGLVDTAVAMARDDGTFLLNAGGWDGALVLVSGDEVWPIALRDGLPEGLLAAQGAPDGHVVTVAAEPAVWDAVLSWPPPPGLADLVGAITTGQVSIEPMPETTERHLAVTRFGELLRHAAMGTDPAPAVVDPDTPP
ncbi:MAG: hypothetical protein ACR2PK_01115, partial [Acidimicrobiales bacterium]